MVSYHKHFLLIRIHDIGALVSQEKLLSTTFPRTKVCPMKELDMDTSNNLHYFFDWPYEHVPSIGIHDIEALDLQEKVFFPPFSL